MNYTTGPFWAGVLAIAVGWFTLRLSVQISILVGVIAAISYVFIVALLGRWGDQ